MMIGLQAQARSSFAEAAPRFTFSGGPKYWEEQLPAERFLRLDRSTIVQASRISRCERQSRSCTLLRFGSAAEATTLAVGSTAAIRLQQALAVQP